MEKRLGQELSSLFGLLLFGLVIFFGLYHFMQRFATEPSVHSLMGSNSRPDAFYNETPPSEPARGRYVLHLNESLTVGKASLTYRGLTERSYFLVDVIIPELDPRRPYKYSFTIDTAEQGFRLAGHDFKLDSIGADYVRLVREMPPSE